MKPRAYFAIEEQRGGKLLSEICTGSDHLIGYVGYLIDPCQKQFTPRALDRAQITQDDIYRIRQKATNTKPSYNAARKALAKKGATHCIYCHRTIDDCLDYESCMSLTKIKE